jgi:hypothetical protein
MASTNSKFFSINSIVILLVMVECQKSFAMAVGTSKLRAGRTEKAGAWRPHCQSVPSLDKAISVKWEVNSCAASAPYVSRV